VVTLLAFYNLAPIHFFWFDSQRKVRAAAAEDEAMAFSRQAIDGTNVAEDEDDAFKRRWGGRRWCRKVEKSAAIEEKNGEMMMDRKEGDGDEKRRNSLQKETEDDDDDEEQEEFKSLCKED